MGGMIGEMGWDGLWDFGLGWIRSVGWLEFRYLTWLEPGKGSTI